VTVKRSEALEHNRARTPWILLVGVIGLGGKPDSFASRLTLAVGNNFSGQFSIGRINNREALEPDLDTLRTTAFSMFLRIRPSSNAAIHMQIMHQH